MIATLLSIHQVMPARPRKKHCRLTRESRLWDNSLSAQWACRVWSKTSHLKPVRRNRRKVPPKKPKHRKEIAGRSCPESKRMTGNAHLKVIEIARKPSTNRTQRKWRLSQNSSSVSAQSSLMSAPRTKSRISCREWRHTIQATWKPKLMDWSHAFQDPIHWRHREHLAIVWNNL